MQIASLSTGANFRWQRLNGVLVIHESGKGSTSADIHNAMKHIQAIDGAVKSVGTVMLDKLGKLSGVYHSKAANALVFEPLSGKSLTKAVQTARKTNGWKDKAMGITGVRGHKKHGV